MTPWPRPDHTLRTLLERVRRVEERLGELERVESRVTKLEALERNLRESIERQADHIMVRGK